MTDKTIPGYVAQPTGDSAVSLAARLLTARAARLGRLHDLGAPRAVLEPARDHVWQAAAALLTLTADPVAVVPTDALAAMYAILDGRSDEAEAIMGAAEEKNRANALGFTREEEADFYAKLNGEDDDLEPIQGNAEPGFMLEIEGSLYPTPPGVKPTLVPKPPPTKTPERPYMQNIGRGLRLDGDRLPAAPPFERLDRVKRRGHRHGHIGRVVLVQADKERCLVEWPTKGKIKVERTWLDWTDLTKVAGKV
jgi:hypothetical protein